jgi:hypothetical protein
MNGGPGKARRLEQAKQVALGLMFFVINRRTSFAPLLSVLLGGSDASWAQSDPIRVEQWHRNVRATVATSQSYAAGPCCRIPG